MINMIRELFAERGLDESSQASEPGFYLMIEDVAEISIHYNDIERERASTRALPSNRTVATLLKLCSDLTPRGFALTLFLSPRMLALHVRDES